jgi:DNA-binding Lrp family transcriptional regulator
LVHATQAGLPLCPDPYGAVGETLGLDADEVIDRLTRLLAAGIIRRIGAVPNHYALGYRANGMSVWDINDGRIGTLGPRVAMLPFVSHCYRRPRRPPLWPYNLFAMVHGRSRAGVETHVAEIADVLGAACRARDVLYSTRILKKTGLRIAPPAREAPCSA